MSVIPQGFLDQVNAVFSLKVQAEASAAFAKDAEQKLTQARADFTDASNTAQGDNDALANARKSLEAIEDAYFTVGGQLPVPTDPTVPQPPTQS